MRRRIFQGRDEEIAVRVARHETHRAIATIYGISPARVGQIAARETRRAAKSIVDKPPA